MADNKMHLGMSPLTERIYLGQQKNGVWCGREKRDVTNEFIQVMLQKFSPNTAQNITVDGKVKYKVIVVDVDKEVSINGKVIE